MAMEINSVYGNYASTYTNSKETKQVKNSKSTSEVDKTEGQQTYSVENTKQNGNVRKTTADELAYLSKKYDGFSFVAANFKPGMRYGSNKTTNVAISPEFLKKMANNPELEEEYEKEIANMQVLDEQRRQRITSDGGTVVAMGWAIDKDGGISCWSISKHDDRRSRMSSPSEFGAKIRQEKAEKKKAEEKVAKKQKEKAEQKEALEEKRKANKEEQAALKEKIDNDNRELLGDKYKGSEWYDVPDNSFAGERAKALVEDAVGLNLDMKL